MHEGESGRRLWADCVRVAIDARKEMLACCHYIKPFIPPTVDGKAWDSYPTEQIATDIRFFAFNPKDKWHHFEGYAPQQYFVDPCKFLLTTPGINATTGEYSDFGIPASILASFLRENGVVPEKSDLNSILFLMTPAEDHAKMAHLITQIARFESFVDDDAPLSEVLPELYNAHKERYKGYTIRELCQEMHDFYKSVNVKDLQKAMFRKEYFPRRVLNAQEANYEFIRDNVELVRLSEAEGRVGVEGALPYPPGVLCLVPGEVWGGAVLQYFLALEEGINLFPGLHPSCRASTSRRTRTAVRSPGPTCSRTSARPNSSAKPSDLDSVGKRPGSRKASGPFLSPVPQAKHILLETITYQAFSVKKT